MKPLFLLFAWILAAIVGRALMNRYFPRKEVHP